MARLRGQAVPIDFIAGLFIFLVLLAYFLILWDIFALSYAESMKRTTMSLQVLAISDQLLGSQGHPFNWTVNTSTVKMVGFAGARQNSLDSKRIAAFAGMNYAEQKQALSLDHNFYIRVEKTDGIVYYLFGTPRENTSRASEVTRIATLNGTTVYLKVQLYE